MSDLFHDAVPAEFVHDVWAAMQSTPQHTYQVLTKRPDRMASITSSLPVLKNVWLGTSVESAEYVDRIDDLRKVRAAIRFISFEPLLGSVAHVDLSEIHWAIVGGESGPRSRPMLEDWVDEIELACRKAKTAFFFKQWGAFAKTGRVDIFATGRSTRCLLFRFKRPNTLGKCFRSFDRARRSSG